jgi:putative tryptophan/tyrosine transport system substrate-binding protein
MTIQIDRRSLIAGLGCGALARPLPARAQKDGRVRQIAILARASDDPEAKMFLPAFHQGLQKLGWTEGTNVRIEVRFALDASQFEPLARELVSSQPDVILAQTTPLVAALLRATRSIPIVFATGVSDPVGSGFIQSLARPGGNVTGFLLYEEGIVGKWLAMLKEIAPSLRRAALIADPRNTPYDYYLRAAQTAAPDLGIDLVPIRLDGAVDLEQAITSFASVPNGGLVILPDTGNVANRDKFSALTVRFRLPAVYALRLYVTAGGLMSYDTDRVDQFRQAAGYVDRILKGEKPADLPVQAPTKFETVVNLKAAKAIGLDVPASLLVRADEVIE